MVIFRHFCSKNDQFSMKFHDNSRNRIYISRKIVFSFVSAHCASFMKMGWKLREGVCISFVGTKPKYFLTHISDEFFSYSRKTFIWKNVIKCIEIFLVEIFFFQFFLWARGFFSLKNIFELWKKKVQFFHNIYFFEEKKNSSMHFFSS